MVRGVVCSAFLAAALRAQANCYSTPEPSITIPAAGTTATALQVIKASGCALLFPPSGKIIPNDNWITVRNDIWYATGASGMFAISVPANIGGPRTGTITAGNLTFTVRQLATSSPLPVTGTAVPQLSGLDAKMLALLLEFGAPGGALAVAYQNRLVYARGFGYADLATLEPVQPDSIFRLASVSKLMTIAATNNLVANSQLTLATNVVNRLALSPPPGQSLNPSWNTMTVDHLLNMKAGFLTTTLDRALDRNYLVTATQALGIPLPGDDLTRVRYALGQPLDYTPGFPPGVCGSNFFAPPCYSNFGYQVLGRVIEKAGGLAYEDYVNAALMAPVGVSRIRAAKSFRDQNWPGEVRYYGNPNELWGTSVFPSPDGAVPLTYGAYAYETLDSYGGMTASTPDLLRFYRRWVNGYYFNGSLTGTNTTLFFVQPLGSDIQVAILFNYRSNYNRTNTPTCTVASPCDVATAAQKDVIAVLGGVSTLPTSDLFGTFVRTSPACVVSVPISANSPAAASIALIPVSTADYCGWSSIADSAWLGFAEGRFTTPRNGSGTLQVHVAANAGTPRAGTVVIGGQVLTINQAGVGPAVAILTPAANATLTGSVVNFSWSPAPGVGRSYDFKVVNTATGKLDLSLSIIGDLTNQVYTFKSGLYQILMRVCDPVCGAPIASNFTVQLPTVPTAAPSGLGCQVVNDSSHNRLNCNWTAVARSDFYFVNVVQPGAGPGGGALTVAGTQSGSNSISLVLPNGNASVLVKGCNGDGCGPFAGPVMVNPGFGSPAVPTIAEPFGGSVVDAGSQTPVVVFAWNRVAGDTGSNYKYRLYVQDFSRNAAAVDVITANNFHAAYLNPFTRYDALVIAIPNSGGPAVQGPAQGFVTKGKIPNAPSYVSPVVYSSVAAGSVRVGWTPIPDSNGDASNRTYQYFLAGPTNFGGVVQQIFANLTLPPGAYNGIVRVCAFGAVCSASSEANWGPWTGSATGEGGPTLFTVQ